MMTHKRRFLALLLLSVALLIAACGRSSEPTATPVPPPTEPPPTATAAPTATPAPAAAMPTAEPAPATATPLPQLGAITVGVNAGFEPFVFIDQSNAMVGFDIDLMNALSQAGGFELGFVDVPFDTFFDKLAAGEFDAAISAITITDDRKELVDFTAPYFESGQASVAYFNSGQGLAVRADNMAITGRDDLTAEVKVGVKQGTTGAEFISAQTPAQAVSYPEADPALLALAAGEVDAVVIDIPVIVSFIKANPGAGIKIVGGPITEEEYGIAVSKDKPEVLAALDAALTQIREDGTYDAIFQKWFGAP